MHVRGYHIYKETWTAVIGRELVCSREATNAADKNAVAVVKGETLIGHLPRKLSEVCSLFLLVGHCSLATYS